MALVKFMKRVCVIWGRERGGERVGMVERHCQSEKFILTTFDMADLTKGAVQRLGVTLYRGMRWGGTESERAGTDGKGKGEKGKLQFERGPFVQGGTSAGGENGETPCGNHRESIWRSGGGKS